MFSLYTNIINDTGRWRKLTCNGSLFSVFNCKMPARFQDLWSPHNYILYVMEGRKVWHTIHGSFELNEGSCVFVRKGAAILEQLVDKEFCFFLFFIPDEFICDVLKTRSKPVIPPKQRSEPIVPIHNSATIMTYFQSMLPYFEDGNEPDPSLLELKFKELVLAIAEQGNGSLLSYFCSLLNEPRVLSVQRVMEENFCYNLGLEEFARLSSRSLSAFKRDFEKIYAMPPGKWLMQKRLDHSLHLLTNLRRSVAEAAYESGFENSAHFSRSFRNRFGRPPVAVKQLAAM